MPLRSSARLKWPSRSFSLSSMSVLSILSFPMLLWCSVMLWTPSGMAILLPCLPWILLGGISRSFVLSILKHILTHFTASSAHHQCPWCVLMFLTHGLCHQKMFHWSSAHDLLSPSTSNLWGLFGTLWVCQMVKMGLESSAAIVDCMYANALLSSSNWLISTCCQPLNLGWLDLDSF